MYFARVLPAGVKQKEVQPMAGANEVQAALSEALATDGAESQSAEESSTEVADALAQTLESDADEGDESASESETDESAKGADKGQTVPVSRLSKVVKQKNEISERFVALEEQFKAATARENELRDRIGGLEQDSQILDAIKNLARDEKYRDHVVAIDKALQGIEDEIEDANDKGDEKAVSTAEKRFEQKAAELENLVADQRAENLWNEASGLAKDMLAALPEEYTDEDRAVIGKLWTPRVDWNGIEEKGSESIPNALNHSFAEVIKEYGTPRGALVAKTTKEIESRIPEAKVTSDEDAIKGLLAKNWAETNDEGNIAVSDDEFSQGMAEMLRRTRGA